MASRTDRNLTAFYRINLVLQGFLKNIPIESLQLLCGFGVANKGTTIPINLRSANTWPAAASNFGEFGEYSLFIAPLQKPLIPGPSQTSDFCRNIRINQLFDSANSKTGTVSQPGLVKNLSGFSVFEV